MPGYCYLSAGVLLSFKIHATSLVRPDENHTRQRDGSSCLVGNFGGEANIIVDEHHGAHIAPSSRYLPWVGIQVALQCSSTPYTTRSGIFVTYSSSFSFHFAAIYFLPCPLQSSVVIDESVRSCRSGFALAEQPHDILFSTWQMALEFLQFRFEKARFEGWSMIWGPVWVAFIVLVRGRGRQW